VPEAASRVALQGREGLEMQPDSPPELAEELGWGSQLLLTATAAASLVVIWHDQQLLRRGLLAEGPFTPGALCQRTRASGKTISLVDLSLYPGRAEFDGLLAGLPAVVVHPLGQEGWLVVGGWSARCFSRGDLLWLEGWAQRLRARLLAWRPAA